MGTTINTLGCNMRDAVAFLRRHLQPWHSYNSRDRATVAALRRLRARGLVLLDEDYTQFSATQKLKDLIYETGSV